MALFWLEWFGWLGRIEFLIFVVFCSFLREPGGSMWCFDGQFVVECVVNLVD
jgi:hypothetical protein